MSKAIPEDHKATVHLGDDGKLSFTSNDINMISEDAGGPRKAVSVVPGDERIVDINDHPEHFSRLTSLNVSLTNACNLNCTYCYEQHRRDFGRFTVDNIKQAYNFLRDINDLEDKTLIFFGGEPLIHAPLILDFLKTHGDEIKRDGITITMITNGLLMTPQFIEEYFGYSFTQMCLSLDTFDAEVDSRQIGQKRLDALKATLSDMDAETILRLTVRPTITFETALGLQPFLIELYNIGIRSFIMQPLIMANMDGFIEWSDVQWERLVAKIMGFYETHTDIHIEVTEGVGHREVGNNCLSGYDIISIDPSGDFSGCFFFVNQKEAAGDLISGNIFKGKLYIEREENFDKAYRQMFVEHEQCRQCDLQDHCYQCPAGNLDTTKQLFRPDGMCQRFVKFYLDLQVKMFEVRYVKTLNEMQKVSKWVILRNFYHQEFGIWEPTDQVPPLFAEKLGCENSPQGIWDALCDQKGIQTWKKPIKDWDDMICRMGATMYDI